MTNKLVVVTCVVLTSMLTAGLPPAGETVPRAAKLPDDRTNEMSEGGFFWSLPRGFPEPSVPADNPMSAAKVSLGRHLFYDPRLSRDGSFSCATCHRQELAFTDGRSRALGVTGESHPRSAMSLANVAYSTSLGWDDPNLKDLESQARVPLLNQMPVEMGFPEGQEIWSRLRVDPVYDLLLAEAFPGEADPFDLDHVVRAIAAFERTLVSGTSPFDRWLFDDDQAALSPEARRGFALFTLVGCARCHRPPFFSGTPRFRQQPEREAELHNTGLYDLDGEGAYPSDNQGLFRTTRHPGDMGKFRAPSLRNLAWTAPYMHDGSVEDLASVIDLYAAGGRTRSPLKSPLMQGFELSKGEKDDLLAFLTSLNDPDFVGDERFSDPWPNSTGN